MGLCADRPDGQHPVLGGTADHAPGLGVPAVVGQRVAGLKRDRGVVGATRSLHTGAVAGDQEALGAGGGR